ncbi:MAG: proteasome accessory factor PafA2 family protein [Actinomycetales bacterium]|nr:proteasome accessory factor PafA2 family protein [Candidatus Phosphoribacter baldrii]
MRQPAGPTHLGGASPQRQPAAARSSTLATEPHADAEKFRRLHVIVGDSNMSETTTLLK